jgi:hypothetical protein
LPPRAKAGGLCVIQAQSESSLLFSPPSTLAVDSRSSQKYYSHYRTNPTVSLAGALPGAFSHSLSTTSGTLSNIKNNFSMTSLSISNMVILCIAKSQHFMLVRDKFFGA